MRELTQPVTFMEPTLIRAMDGAQQETSFADLVKRQSGFVFRIAYSVLRNTHDAEDVVQETFLKLHRSGKFSELSDERAFLARVAWRLAVSRPRAKNATAPDVDIPSRMANPEQAVLTADTNAVVHRLIDSLPTDLRTVLTLSAIQELSSAEIGKIVGVPDGTVRRRLMRARETLKAKLLALKVGNDEK